MHVHVAFLGCVAGVLAVVAGCTGAPAPQAESSSENPVLPYDPAFAQHAAQVRQRVPEAFTVVEQPPFVVVGDESPEMVRKRATDTVQWAVDRLKALYFDCDPAETMEIWLFRDKESYTKHAFQLFGDTPATPFGYYSAEHRALVMNIATGGGTLVHEIVHPYMHANFPECPVWFNEGLASLYEGCIEKDGRIHGLTNWRLSGLKDAIREGKTLSFEQLMALSEEEFYGGTVDVGSGVFYAQARYLCYYLQEQGLLVTYYRDFVANAQTDPTGFNTLVRVLGETDMAAFKTKWEAFVQELRFPS
ncbi:MAG: hypothetical protein KBC05_14290 [Candidatus Hydrogenedentes bacterium]|nr:hypothetical protein [Candidatus Hydrogenedentota bacterium]